MKLTITTLVIVEGSYIQGMENSLEEHPGKAYQELTANGLKTAILKNYNMEPIITINEYPIGWEWLDKVPLEDFTWLIEIFSTMTNDTT